MAKFQEENLFRGAAQSQGFAPMQAPDTSRFLRENMGQIDRNFAQLEKAQSTALDNKLKRQQEVLSTLSQFSTTAMEFAKNQGKAYIDQQIIEGQNKARSLGKTLNYGIPAEKERQFDETLNQEKQVQSQMADVALDMGKQNAPIEAINYIKSLPQYQRIGAYRTYLANKAGTYKAYLANFLQRGDINLPRPGGGTFTPQQVDDNPELLQIVLGAASRMFMAEEVGIGADFNPTGVAAKPLYEAMDKADDEYMYNIRQQSAINNSADMVAQARETFRANGDLNAYLSSLTGSINEYGKMRGRSEALTEIFKEIETAYAAGDTEILNSLDQPVDGDAKGQTWRQRFANRIEGEKGLNAAIDAIDRRNRARLDEQENEEMKQRERSWREAKKDMAKRGVVPTDAMLKAALDDAMKETGRPASAFPWITNTMTQEKQDREQEKTALNALRRKRGYLIESDLRDVSMDTYRDFISTVQNDEPLAKLPTHFEADAKSKINALTDDHFKVTEGDAPKTNDWQDMARRARDAYRVYIQENIQAGMTQQEAQQKALDRVERNFAVNTYSKDPNVPSTLRYRQTLSSARTSMANRPKIDTYVFNGTDNELKQLQAYSKGQGAIPKLYYDLAVGQKNLTAWDIAAAQYRAAGYGELGKSTERVQYERMDPAIQTVIDYKPNVNKLNRATTSSFNAQTSSLPNPALKRAADIVAKYEAAGAGYNAVNQIGIKGGTATLGFSGDFRKMTQHAGRALTDMTVGEIMDLQAEPSGTRMSNTDWIKQGKLHAVGRYQFIGPTLKGLVQRLGISRDQKFTSDLQDTLFLSLLKSGGLGQWVGPTNHATAEEKALIEQARSLL